MTAKESWDSNALLADTAPELERALTQGTEPRPRFEPDELRRETVKVSMRDGTQLATDIYYPPHLPAPAIAMRTPYGKSTEKNIAIARSFAQHGYVFLAQD